MKRIRLLPSIAVAVLLAGCGKEPDPLPVETEILDDRVIPVDYRLGIFSLDKSNGVAYGARGRELFVIDDNGERINNVNRFEDRINAIHAFGNHIFVATDNDHWDPEAPCRIYRSTDGGGTFSLSLTLEASSALWWSIDSDSRGRVFVGEYGPREPGISKQVHRSDDGGQTWQVVFRAENNDGVHIHRVAVDPYTDDVWVTVGDGRDNRGVFRSRDGGDTWDRVIDSQATAIAFTRDAVYLGEDHDQEGRLSRFEREGERYREIFRAADFGNYGGSVYDIAAGSNGLVYVPTMKYADQDHIASLWAGRGDQWTPLLRLKSETGKGTGLSTIAGPDKDGWLYVTGFKIKDR
jgi:photosystem II stability/assembly factor-like uncharacterized protein